MKLGQVECDICTAVFTTEEYMMQHRKCRHHYSEKYVISKFPTVYVCNYCTYTCKIRNSMRIHYDHYHDDEFPEQRKDDVNRFHCNMCTYGTNIYCHLKRHTLIHTGEKPHKCNICKFTCNQSNSLVRHKLIHASNSHKCNICSYMCKNIHKLNKHKTKHMC